MRMANYRITVSGTLPGETFNFGLHASGPAGDAAGCATAAATALTDWWTDATDPGNAIFTNDISIVAVRAAELDPLTGKQIDASESALALTGAAAGDMLPHEVSVAITTRGAAANRRDRGRVYMPPPAQSTSSNGLFLALSAGHLANGFAIVINELQAAGFTPVILHPDQTTTQIVELDVGDVFDVQRRRRNKLIEVRTRVGV